MKITIQAENEEEAKLFRTGAIELDQRCAVYEHVQQFYMVARNIAGQPIFHIHGPSLEEQLAHARMLVDVLESNRQRIVCQQAIQLQMNLAAQKTLSPL